MEELTDEAICEKVQNGDTELFGVLVERYEPKLKRYARRFLFDYDDSQDMVQEVFIKAFVNLQSFDISQRFSPWIYRVAHNLFINAIKKKGREPLSFFDPDTLFPHPVSPDKADTAIKETELKEMMDAYVSKLEPKYREPLILYYYEDMDYQGISEILRIPVSTVGVRLNRAKKALQKHYANSTINTND